MNTQVNKIAALKRLPPGDRWTPVDVDEPIPEELKFDSLTDGLEWLYKNKNSKKFVVDTEDEIVYIIGEEEQVKKPKESKYSIYGE